MMSSQPGTLMYVADRPGQVMVRGEGSLLWDEAGKQYLDFVQGWAVNSLGHCHPAIVHAIQAQAAQLINPSPAYFNRRMIELSALLVEHSCLDRVFLANTGAEANEGAIKLARKWGAMHKNGAYEIITMANSFHGRTLATMSASGKPLFAGLFEPKVPGFVKVPLNDIGAARAAIGARTVAVMLEPIQGEAGVIPADDAYLRGLRELTTEKGVLLIVDEVQTGIGRTGALFAYQHAGIEPDIMTLGKGLGGGAPIAALLAKEAVCCFAPGDQGGTYNGNPLMAAVGCAVLQEVLRSGFLERVVQRGQYLRGRLAEISAEFGQGEVRGRGLLLAMQLKAPVAREVVSVAMGRGLLINAPQADVLRFMPSLLVTPDEIDRMVRLLQAAMTAVISRGR